MAKRIFVFPGLGAQWAGMGRSLLAADPVFAAMVAELDQLFIAAGEVAPGELLRQADPQLIDRSDLSHLLTFSYQVGLSRSLASRGIIPAAVIGHSSGEVAAAHCAGILSTAAAVELVVAHLALIRQVDGQGEMLFAAIPHDLAKELVSAQGDVAIAAFNSHASVVFSGPATALGRLAVLLDRQKFFNRRLRTSLAFHSPILDPHLEAFQQSLAALATAPAGCVYYSALTGNAFAGPWDADYWRRHIRNPVQFSPALQLLLATHPGCDLLEISPHPALALGLRADIDHAHAPARVVSLMERGCDELERLAALPALLASTAAAVDGAGVEVAPEEILQEELTRLLGAPPALSAATTWFDLGITSLQILQLAERLGLRLQRTISPALFFRQPLVLALLPSLAAVGAKEKAACLPPSPSTNPVAIIGMAFRFPPNLDSPARLADFLRSGASAITAAPDERGEELAGEVAGFLRASPWDFDARYFNISAAEAQALDPQQRLLLEVSCHALEDAMLPPGSLRGANVGVFLGISTDDFKELSQRNNESSPYSATGNMFNTASGRLSYFHDFRGPAISVDTACSSSLVALHQAARALRSGDCDLALAGGVNLILSRRLFAAMRALGALSPSGSCKPFAASADGYARGEGCALLVLKRLDAALADDDHILAVIRGSAINQDGRSNGLTAPNGAAQSALLGRALADAHLGVDEISLVETHGTGTPLGDPIEIAALAEALADRDPALPPVVLGALKSQLGHLEACAGVAGVIKSILALQRREVPGIRALEPRSRYIDWSGLPLQAAADPLALPASRPLRAGISAFGFSGTNAHLLLEEAPLRPSLPPAAVPDLPFLFALSAKSAESLRQLAAHYQQGIAAGELAVDLHLGWSQLTTRNHHPYRFAMVVSDRRQLLDRLQLVARQGEGQRIPAKAGKLAMLLPGQGTQYVGMGRELYQNYPVFRAAVDDCAARCDAQGFPVLATLYPEHAAGAANIDASPYAQLSYLAFAWGAFALWRSFGIKPDLLIGHSLGEYIAAALAGALTLDDTIRLIVKRGELTANLPVQGRMATVLAERAVVTGLLADFPGLDIAVVNGPNQLVVAGEEQELAAFCTLLAEQKIDCKPLAIHFASHCRLIEPALAPFAAFCATIDYRLPQIPVITNLTGEPFAAGATFSASYWSEHLRQPVDFGRCLATATRLGVTDFIELGPSSVLTSIIRAGVTPPGPGLMLTASRTRPPWPTLLAALAELYLRGIALDWPQVFAPFAPRKVALPLYPFDRQPFLLPEGLPVMNQAEKIPSNAPPAPLPPAPLSGTLSTLSQLVQRITWKETSELDPTINLFELGIDSLMLVQIRGQIDKEFGVNIPLGGFYEEFDSLEKIAAHLAASVPPALPIAALPLLAAPARSVPASAPAPPGMNELFARQLEAMRELCNRQLDLLAHPAPAAADAAAPPLATPKFNFRSMRLTPDPLSAEQERFIADFAARFNRQTAGSKAQATRYRRVLADWINSLGYKQSLKELVYPIVAERSQGSHFVDIDGNDYIDLAMGYGVTFLGHRPEPVVNAMRVQLEKGFELGPQSRLAGEVAELVSELTGVERVAFCNTGSEAVMVAIRLARAVTGREKIIIFGNSYHGTFDTVLATAVDGTTYPTAAGIPRKMVEDVQILTYGGEEALELIRAQGGTLAAVLVEPVQSRNPTLRPVEFLRQLREITQKEEIALIFDETITGFRMHPGGTQNLFGVRADLVIYGKAVGGGMPMSLVAGSARYLDAIDGGDWAFGDDSHPSDNVTFFGGTYVKHPLALAAAKASLTIIKDEGAALQQRVGNLLDELVTRVNSFFVAAEVPVRVAHFGSMFRFEGQGKYSLALDPIEMDLFFHLLMEQGIYTWERRICFISAAHSRDDIDRVCAAVEESIARLRAGGFPFRTPAGKKAAMPLLLCPDLTSAQLRLLVFDQLAGEKTLYNLPLAYRLAGEIDPQRLEGAIATLLRRHPALTARFTLAEEHPGQEYVADFAFRLERREGEGKEIAALIDDFVRPFDLAEELLVRAALCRLAAGEHLLLFDFHHLVADGLALSIFVQELMTLYAGQSLSLPPPHYAEFVVAEGAYRRSAAAAADQDFWLAQFALPLPPLALPLDSPRPAVQDHRGDNVFFRIPPAATALLKGVAGRAGVSLFSLLLVGYGVMLQRLSGEARLAIGIPVDARPAGFEQAVGMFASTLALPLSIDPQLPFRVLARQVQKDFLNAYEHQRYPFDDLVRALQTPRDLGRNPLFDTMFIFENGQNRLFQLPGLVCTPCDYNKPTAMFDLTFEVIEADGALNCRLEYATALFQRRSMERLAGRLEHLLATVGADPDRPPASIEFLSADESEVLAALNATAHPFDTAATIPQLWSRQVEKDPAGVALVCAGESFSRRWLDDHANTIARALALAVELQPDDRVAILMERSAWAVAALLGILKSGAAYVPISPDFPAERRTAILAGSGARALVTSRLQRGEWSDNCGVPVIVVEDLEAAAAPAVTAPGLTADHLAYIMFTSGSTGAPKGVMISHRNVVAMSENLPLVYGITAADTLLAVTTFTFDISVLEIFSCLLVGTRIILASDDDNLAITPLAGLLNAHGVTAFQTTPSRLKLMLELSGEAAVLGPLRTILIGGEAFPADLFVRLRSARPRIFNVYGPTETTIWSTSTLINGKEEATIGRPLLNEQVHILDRQGRPVPPGGIGELYIGGEGVGRGYLGMPELTARKFIANPWGEGRERLYATGDLVRLREDGDLEFLGRGDDQIKLRGYRIELQEIENRLVTHPALLQAAVKTVLDPGSGEVRDLAAYYTLRHGSQVPTVEELREHLGQWLPPYMLPAYYLALEKMPLNPSGKIDRKALPEARPAPVASPRPPAGGSEEPLATILAQVLGVSAVQADDNFFALGGDSIRAILVAARARAAGIELDVRQLFAHPTLRDLVAMLAAAPAQNAAPARAPRPEAETVQRLSLAPMQEGMLFHSLLDAAAEAYVNQAEFTLRADLDGERFAVAWQSLSDRHAMLRTRFATRNTPNPCQLVLPRHQADLRQEDLSALPAAAQEEALAALRRSERARLARLDAAPPIAILLVRRGDQEWSVLWSFHHILLDGWSIAILLREFLSLYRGESLPAVLGDFPDYLHWLASRNQEEALLFWQEALAGARSSTLSPPATAVTGYRLGEKDCTLAAPIFSELTKIARSQALTVNALLQAAWAVLLQGVTGQDDLLFGATVSGRPAELAGVEEMVGLFINTLPIRVRLPGSATLLTELARRIQEQNLAALPHQHLSLATIQAASGFALFDHLLIFENYPLERGVAELLTAPGGESPVTAVSFFEHTHYPLEVILLPQEDLRMTFRYNRNAVDDDRIADLAERFLALLTALASDPALTVVALSPPLASAAATPAPSRPPVRSPACPSTPAAPSGESERRLCTLFARILELPAVSADDHFFTCGGHSLKVVRLAGLIWEELGVEVPLRLIYTHPTPRTLATALAATSPLSPLEMVAGPSGGSYPLSAGQKGLWLLQQLQPTSSSYNTVGSYLLRGALDPVALAAALAACARRHEALRTSFHLEEGEPCQRLSDSLPPLLQRVDLQSASDAPGEVRRQIRQQLTTPFALQELPLFRATLFTLNPDRHVLSLIFHHIISDGWSDVILARDLSQFYRAALTGVAGDLPPLPLHYRDFALAQQRYLSGEKSQKARSFWADTLAGELPVYDLLLDHPRPEVRAGQGARLLFALGEEEAEGVRLLARQERITPFVVLQGLLKILIYALTAADDLIVGVPSANRSHPATHGLVGYFLNPLPIRSELRDDEPFTLFLGRVQQATLAAFEHEDYPFSAMVDDLKIPRRPNRHPLFDVMLIFHNNQPLGFDLPEVECTPFFADSVTSRFDLDFEFFDDEKMSAFIEFDSELYNAETVARIALAFTTLTAAVLAQSQLTSAALAAIVSKDLNATDDDFIQQMNLIGDDF